MRIEPNNKPTELSYIDLLSGLKADISSDTALPSPVEDSANIHIAALMNLLQAYSA